MPFCTQCGASVNEGVAFCGRCGAPLSAAPAVPPAPAAGAGMASNVAALLAYVFGFITGIVFLILQPYKNDRFVRFHAFQSIFFSVAVTVFWILWSNVFWMTFLSIGPLWAVLSLISTLVSLAVFLYWLFLMYKAYNNERYMIPFLGELAAKQAG
jgi:uncharacterized membrane protein